MTEEFDELMQRYGLQLTLPITNVNVGTYNGSQTKLTYADLYPDTIKAINEYASIDFQMLGYEMVESFFDERYSLSADGKRFFS